MKRILFLATIVAVLFSCNENTVNIVVENPNVGGGTAGGGSKKSVGVSFTANVNPVLTKAGTTVIQANRYVSVYAFVYQGDFVDSMAYKSNSQGNLVSLTSDTMRVVTGDYEFFAIGIANQSTPPPVFTDFDTGFATGVTNGVDYIAGSINKQSISSNSSLSMTLNHIATQLVVNITSGSSQVVIDSLASATITPPSEVNATITLFGGAILTTTSLSSTPLAMNRSGLSYNQILLPLKYTGGLTLNFGAYVNGEKTPQLYTITIPVVGGALKAGNSYVFSVLLNDNQVLYNDFQINNWTEVNETGTPITPTPVA